MAALGATISLEYEKRLCEVHLGKKKEIGYFHQWEQYADVVPPGLTVGSHPGGQYARVFGIVEFVDRVARVDPCDICFIDEETARPQVNWV